MPRRPSRTTDPVKGKIRPRQARAAADPEAEKFAFIIHPLDTGHITRKYRFAGKVPKKLVAWTLKHKRPWAVSEITGIVSKTGKRAVGWFIVVPLLPSQILDLKEKFVVKKIIKGTEVATKLGAGIVGLGAFTALVGGGGKKIAAASDIAVTTGNTYTVATAIEGARKAAAIMDIDFPKATVAVVGATGSIGKIAAIILAREAGRTYLVGRNRARLKAVKDEIESSRNSEPAEGGLGKLIVTTNVAEAVRAADVIVTATSAVEDIIDPADIKPGAVVCDVARPRDVAERVAEARRDVLVIDGGVVKVPGRVDFGFDIGLPKGLSLACMAETMILALEGRYEDYTVGREISIAQVREMTEMANRHGFELAGLRSFEKALSEEAIARIKKNAALAK